MRRLEWIAKNSTEMLNKLKESWKIVVMPKCRTEKYFAEKTAQGYIVASNHALYGKERCCVVSCHRVVTVLRTSEKACWKRRVGEFIAFALGL